MNNACEHGMSVCIRARDARHWPHAKQSVGWCASFGGRTHRFARRCLLKMRCSASMQAGCERVVLHARPFHTQQERNAGLIHVQQKTTLIRHIYMPHGGSQHRLCTVASRSRRVSLHKCGSCRWLSRFRSPRLEKQFLPARQPASGWSGIKSMVSYSQSHKMITVL
jgi:hypothetical protein